MGHNIPQLCITICSRCLSLQQAFHVYESKLSHFFFQMQRYGPSRDWNYLGNLCDAFYLKVQNLTRFLRIVCLFTHFCILQYYNLVYLTVSVIFSDYPNEIFDIIRKYFGKGSGYGSSEVFPPLLDDLCFFKPGNAGEALENLKLSFRDWYLLA